MALSGEFDPKRFDFVETAMLTEVHENFEDVIEDKIFKFKYRQYADPYEIYEAR